MESGDMNQAVRWNRFPGPLGAMLVIASDEGLLGIHFEGERYEPVVRDEWTHRPDDPLLRRAQAQLDEYFGGSRRAFDLPLAPSGTAFQRDVWRAIAGVAFGATISYRELAIRAGRPQSVRAAGAATGRNPWTIVVPCHRIVGTDGSLTGYAGGLGRKRELLALEAGQRRLAEAA
jgi:methylated-DNA-[protein]-cysteine S-methyltransferase